MSFNTQPPEGGWLPAFVMLRTSCGFQHTAARRRLGCAACCSSLYGLFQHTAARRRLAGNPALRLLIFGVSTHSRPKAAGFVKLLVQHLERSFNTQPPEGGWPLCRIRRC